MHLLEMSSKNLSSSYSTRGRRWLEQRVLKKSYSNLPHLSQNNHILFSQTQLVQMVDDGQTIRITRGFISRNLRSPFRNKAVPKVSKVRPDIIRMKNFRRIMDINQEIKRRECAHTQSCHILASLSFVTKVGFLRRGTKRQEQHALA